MARNNRHIYRFLGNCLKSSCCEVDLFFPEVLNLVIKLNSCCLQGKTFVNRFFRRLSGNSPREDTPALSSGNF